MTDPDAFSEHLSFDEAAERYEQNPTFLDEAIDALAHDTVYPLPDDLADALMAWYRATDVYARSVQYVIEEAEKP